MNISIIIPLYNSSLLLPPLINEIEKACKDISYEIIFIDDYSSDNTWQVIEKLKNDFSNIHIKAIRLNKNYGQHNAILCGLRYSDGDHIITMDDDMEVLPADMIAIYHQMKDKTIDLAYANYQKKYDSTLRSLLTGYFYFWAKLVSKGKWERGSGYRIVSKRIIDEVKNHHTEVFFVDELITWYTSNVEYYKVKQNPNKVVKSRYTIKKLFNTSLGMILFAYLLPIRSVSVVGGIIAIVNFIIGIYFIGKKFLFKIPIEGYTSLIVSILFSTGIILLFMGILAEYINRVLRVSGKAPNYFIDKTL